MSEVTEILRQIADGDGQKAEKLIQELRLRPGQHQLRVFKKGRPMKRELVTITRGERKVVTIRLESPTITTEARTKGPDHASIPQRAITQVGCLESEFDLNYWVNDLAFSPSGAELWCGRASQVVEVWNLESRQRTTVKPIGSKLAVSASGNVVAVGHPDQARVTLSSLDTLEKIHVFVLPETVAKNRIRRVSLSSDGRYVACGSGGVHGDCTARVWDVNTGQELQCLDCDRPCWIAEFSPDGQTVLIGNYTLRLVEVESGKKIWDTSLAGFTAAAAFSPCGRWMIVAPQNQLRLLDVATGEEVRRFEGHSRLIFSAQFLPDGRHVLSGSDDRTMRLWNVTNFVAVSPDGRSAASGGGQFTPRPGEYLGDGDYDIRLWRLPESVWPRELSPPEPSSALGAADEDTPSTVEDSVAGQPPTVHAKGGNPHGLLKPDF